MRNKRELQTIVIILIATLGVFACSGQSHFQDLEDYLSSLKQKNIFSKNKEQEFPWPTPVTYQSVSRSPFTASDEMFLKNGNVSNPLQAYPLNMLRFVGTVSANGTTYAYIIAPDSKLYQVKVGDELGDHGGHVANISDSEVNVTEQQTDNGKSPGQQTVTLQLKGT